MESLQIDENDNNSKETHKVKLNEKILLLGKWAVFRLTLRKYVKLIKYNAFWAIEEATRQCNF